MKKILPIILLLLSLTAFGQKTDSTKKGIGLIIKTAIFQPTFNGMDYYPITITFHAFAVTVEKFFKKQHSIQVTFIEGWRNIIFSPMDYSRSNTWALIPEYKFFVSKKKAQTGYYIGAYGYFNFLNNERVDGAYQGIYKALNIGGGISNGLQFYLFKRITINVLLEIGVLRTKPAFYNDVEINPIPVCGCVREPALPAFELNSRFAINIGYKF
ncbi:MAG: DUF3575 domain-containing protein [Bacteroidia bacterium]